MENENLKPVLDWVNEHRRADNRPELAQLVPGLKNHCYECVVARSLGNDAAVYGSFYYRDRLAGSEDTPDFVRDFLAAFDAGVYPELVAS